jgi:threonyl-tRNA synthetase
VEDEVLRAIEFATRLLQTFGFHEYDIYLATRPEKFVGALEDWDLATEALRRALAKRGLDYKLDEGGGAFYGPKVDVKIKDALGRSWQCTTVQFDFNLPERFDMSYIAEDGRQHRPFMVHRALLGSLERFLGVLIEHYAGAFPVWLAPVQAVVVAIADRHAEYGQQVVDKLTEAGLRVTLDSRREKMNLKIRDAQVQKVPYMLVVGDKEVADGTVSVRLRTGENLGPQSVSWAAETIAHVDRARALALLPQS